MRKLRRTAAQGHIANKFCTNASQGLRPAPFPKAGSTPLRWAAATQFSSELGLVDKILILFTKVFLFCFNLKTGWNFSMWVQDC